MNQHLTEQVFTLVRELYQYGVHEVVISPGSRSTPVAIACEAHSKMKTYIHPDERSAGFFALGLIKATKKPVAILCTSGTAASNYTPAVSEADLSQLPLVVLTSDRPHELRNMGAPQAIQQVNMFQSFTKFQCDFPLADGESLTIDMIENTIMQASQYFYGPETGVVHFNLPFREPLLPDLSLKHMMYTDKKPLVKYNKQFDVSIVKPILKEANGIIIAGDCQNIDLSEMLTFSTIHNIPIISCPLSGIRHTMHPNVITTGDHLFKVIQDIEPGFMIRVGKAPVSKSTNQWIKKQNVPQILIQSQTLPKYFPKMPDLYLEMSPNDCFRQLSNLEVSTSKKWLNLWQKMNDIVIHEIHLYQLQVNDEGSIYPQLFEQMTNEDVLFFGNSMPIRDADSFFVKYKGLPYCNRGANGIDGVVSTAMGMAAHKKVTLFIGDISFYHDMNGLIMSKLDHIDINIVVFNNNGGGIFSYLPQSEEEQYFERLFGTPLDLDFSHTAKLYDFNYAKYNVFDKITLPTSGRNIIEIKTDRNDNVLAHRSLTDKIKAAIEDAAKK